MDASDVALASIVRALRDVVVPAVDPANARAREQLRLAIDYLEFHGARLDHLHARARHALRHRIAMASALLDIPGGPTPLVGALESARRVHADAEAGTPQVRAAAEALAAAIASLVREAAGMAPDARERIEHCVLAGTAPEIDLERAWYLPLGFDPDPRDVPPLADALER